MSSTHIATIDLIDSECTKNNAYAVINEVIHEVTFSAGSKDA